MNTSLKWIKALVPGLDCGVQEYVDAMTLSGSKVEGYEQLDADLDKIVIGQVTKIEKHPDADKLVICQVNVGSETLQIVTGAPNVFEGAKVPVVLDGGRVAGGHDGTKTPGGIKIKKGKLRGVESSGMMCSIEELGSNREMFPDAPENGLYIFDEDAPVGENAVAYLGLDDSVVEYEITSNRVDCFSVLGIAREAAATFHKEFVPPVVTETGNNEDVNDYIKVSVKDQDLCSRYTARVVKNIKFAPSPKWMQERLRAHGIRPINNLVDITNYVMEEYGQPMHAYDLDTIEGKEIIVRRAAAGEKFVTLDGQERQLDENVLMICDAKKAVGIAGIMGGENSMVTDDIQTMLFEAATFDGTNIRLSSVCENARFMNIFVKNALAGIPIHLTAGDQGCSFIDVRDVSSALQSIIESNDCHFAEVYNLGTGAIYTIRQIAENVKNIGDKFYGTSVIITEEKSNNCQKVGMDNKLFSETFNWLPAYSMDDMIISLYEMNTNFNGGGKMSTSL